MKTAEDCLCRLSAEVDWFMELEIREPANSGGRNKLVQEVRLERFGDQKRTVRAVEPIIQFCRGHRLNIKPSAEYRGPDLPLMTRHVLEWALVLHPRGSPEMLVVVAEEDDDVRRPILQEIARILVR